MVVLEAASFACVWLVLAISLRSRRWFLVATSQLASNAASRVIPGGAATGGVVQYRMLTQAGLEAAHRLTRRQVANVDERDVRLSWRHRFYRHEPSI